MTERERDDSLLEVRADLVGIRGRRRSLTLSASRPQRSILCFQR
jgi:hypothetical protein